MPCMCGDTACPSCGPAQGFDPVREMVFDWVMGTLFSGGYAPTEEPDGNEGIAEAITDWLGQHPEIADAVEKEARRFARDYAKGRA